MSPRFCYQQNQQLVGDTLLNGEYEVGRQKW